MAAGFSVFHPHRSTRKLAVFGSSRTTAAEPAYALAVELAAAAVAAGFDVMTGAGAGVVEGANRGAGRGNSFGLDVQLPFEHETNPFIASDPRLLSFRYFHTRKLFFLRETAAVVVLPGGFGTLDELFEALTLIQTAKNPPIPVVLLAPPGDNYWQRWHSYVDGALGDRGLIAAQDNYLYCSADSALAAMNHIRHFYRVFHSSRFEADKLQLFLNHAIKKTDIELLNQKFSQLLLGEKITFKPLNHSDNAVAGCLELCFDQRQMGGLYALINHVNSLDY